MAPFSSDRFLPDRCKSNVLGVRPAAYIPDRSRSVHPDKSSTENPASVFSIARIAVKTQRDAAIPHRFCKLNPQVFVKSAQEQRAAIKLRHRDPGPEKIPANSTAM